MPEIQTFTPSDLEIALRHCCVCHSVVEAVHLSRVASFIIHTILYLVLTLPYDTLLLSSPKEDKDDISLYQNQQFWFSLNSKLQQAGLWL